MKLKLLTVCSAIALFSLNTSHAQIISTIAGNGMGGSTVPGPATATSLLYPYQVAYDGAGNLYVAAEFQYVYKINTSGYITLFAGTGGGGHTGDGGPATAAAVGAPQGIAADAAGNVYISDNSNHVVRKVNASGIISTVAGNGFGAGFTGGFSGDGGPATDAELNHPIGLALDATGNNLYIADNGNNVIRKVVLSTGIITSVAGVGTAMAGFSGDGGPATAAHLNSPWDMALDVLGNMYIADNGNEVVRKVNASGAISTFAGIPGVVGYFGDGGPATSAIFSGPTGVGVYGSNVYVADGNYVIRMINASGIINRVAGDGTSGYSGSGGPATAADLGNPYFITSDPAGNLVISDWGANVIWKVTTPATTSANAMSASALNTRIYPNPCAGDFTVSFATPSDEAARVVITNMMGEVIKDEHIITNHPAEIALQAPSGIYFVSIATISSLWNGKIVVEK